MGRLLMIGVINDRNKNEGEVIWRRHIPFHSKLKYCTKNERKQNCENQNKLCD